MKRVEFTNYINERFAVLQVRVNSRGKLNILDLHIHSENFYMYLLNKVYGWNLKNANQENQNVEAIDLIDETNKIVIQVSATSTKQKIENTLSKKSFEEYKKQGYCFKFVSISKPADDLRKIVYKNPYNIAFNAINDILDVASIESRISNMDIPDMERIYTFIKDELGTIPDVIKFDSDLTSIIIILSKLDLSNNEPLNNINSFEIDKKIAFNNLDIAALFIEDYKLYHNNLEKKYKEFDKLGLNKSMAVLHAMRKIYIDAVAKKKYENDDQLFLGIIDEVKEIIINSSNYPKIAIEELDVCVSILVVDAFIRCKIFKNPEGYNYVIAR